VQQFLTMQFSPGQHEPELPHTKAAVDDLDLIDPDFRLSARVTRVKVRMARGRRSTLRS
jgi:hypothetical protein